MCRVPSILFFLFLSTLFRKMPVTCIRVKLCHKWLIVENFPTKWFFTGLSVWKSALIFVSLWKPMALKSKTVRKYNISRALLYRILNNKNWCLERNLHGEDIQCRGRPQKLSERNERLLLRKINVLRRQEGSFTVKRLMLEAGIDAITVSCKTVRRLLHKHGYKYIQARWKGILTVADLDRRLKFPCGIRREYTSSPWTEQVAFYLDGVSFVHRYKPANQAQSTQGRIWRKPEEGLSIGCTAKGSHCGSGGRMAKSTVAISYREGVALCEQYDKLDRHYFKDLVEREFGNMFEKENKGDSKLWIQDGDPSQNSALACCSWQTLGAKLLSIPPRSPDINPNENFFKLVKDHLTKDAITNNITWESFPDFSKRMRDNIEDG